MSENTLSLAQRNSIICKVKIRQMGTRGLDVVLLDESEDKKVSISNPNCVRPEFLPALEALYPHFARLRGCMGPYSGDEVFEGRALEYWQEILPYINLTGLHIREGDDGTEYLVLTGTTPDPFDFKVVGVSTPEINMGATDYKFMPQLRRALDAFREEVWAYLRGEYAETAERELDFQGGDPEGKPAYLPEHITVLDKTEE